MRKKWNRMAICSLIIALAIFVFTYFLYHYMGADGRFAAVYQETATKPFVTLLFGVWGTMFLFSSVMSYLVGLIFYKE